MFVWEATLGGATFHVVALASEPKSAINLVTEESAEKAGLERQPAAPVEAEDSDGTRVVLTERAEARVLVAGREFSAVFYLWPKALPEGAGALLGAPTMRRTGLVPGRGSAFTTRDPDVSHKRSRNVVGSSGLEP